MLRDVPRFGNAMEVMMFAVERIASLGAMALLTVVILNPNPIHAQTDACEVI